MTNRIEKTNKSIIDLLKIQMLPIQGQSVDEFIEQLSIYLRKMNIGRSNRKPLLKYFNRGAKLYANDETNSPCGSLKWEGASKYIQLELSGKGCNYFNCRDDKFKSLFELASAHQGVIKEIDIAVDDFTGKYNLRRINQDFTQGKFNGDRGIKPRRIKSNVDGALSLRIGSLNSFKQFQGYDKSKQLKLLSTDHRYNNWTRLEVSIYARINAPIPLDCLLKPDAFFVGTYPKVLSKVIKGVEPRCIRREESVKTIVDFIRSIQALIKQWGKTHNALMLIFDDTEKVTDLLSRPGLPSSLKLPSYLTFDELLPVLKIQLNEQFKNEQGS